MIGDLPPTWTIARLGDLIDGFDAGRNLRSLGRPAEPGEHGVLKISAVSWGDFRPGENKALLPGDAPRARETVREGDLLISRANTSELVGAAVLVQADHAHLMLPDKILRLRVKKDVAFPPFVLHALRRPETREYFSASASGSSASMRNLSQPKIEATTVPLPPLAEQKRIVAKLEELTARSRRAKEALDAVPPLLDQLRQSILAAAFRGDLTSTSRRQRHHLSDRMKEVREAHRATKSSRGKLPAKTPADWADLPALPHGWTWERADEVVEPGTVVTYGIVLPGPHIESGVPYVRGQDIEDGRILTNQVLRTTPEIATAHTRSELAEGDVLLCIIRHLKVAIVPAGLDGANITQGTVRLRPSAAIDGRFLAAYLSSSMAQGWMKGRYFGLAMPRINVEDAREIPIPVPPIEDQIAIVKVISALNERASRISAQIASAQSECNRLFSAVLQRAFEGKLVPQDLKGEPASVLLDRIRRESTSMEVRRSNGRKSLRGGPPPHARLLDLGESSAQVPRSATIPPASSQLAGLEPTALFDEIFTAFWPHGSLTDSYAIRRLGEHLRDAGRIHFTDLDPNTPLHTKLLAAIDSAVAANHLDRPLPDHVRAIKPDATSYTPDDWHHILLTTLPTTRTDRETAIRSAAEYARDNLGLAFSRLRSDGRIVQALRSAITTAIRRGEVLRHGSTHISRNPDARRAESAE